MTQIPLAGFVAVAGGFLFGAGTALPPVALLLDFDNKPSAVSVEAMKTEVASLMKPSGLKFEWRLRSDKAAAPPAGIALRFKGKCYSNGSSGTELSDLAPYGETVALASTPVYGGSVQPSSHVECDQIRKCISANSGYGKHQQELALGRAMGRVVAHELFHILADTRKHASHGVAKSIQNGTDLVSGEAEFDPYDTEMLRSPRGRPGISAFGPQ